MRGSDEDVELVVQVERLDRSLLAVCGLADLGLHQADARNGQETVRAPRCPFRLGQRSCDAVTVTANGCDSGDSAPGASQAEHVAACFERSHRLSRVGLGSSRIAAETYHGPFTQRIPKSGGVADLPVEGRRGVEMPLPGGVAAEQ